MVQELDASDRKRGRIQNDRGPITEDSPVQGISDSLPEKQTGNSEGIRPGSGLSIPDPKDNALRLDESENTIKLGEIRQSLAQARKPENRITSAVGLKNLSEEENNGSDREAILKKIQDRLKQEQLGQDAVLTAVSRIKTKAIVEILNKNPDNFRIQLLCMVFEDYLTRLPKRAGRTNTMIERVESFLRVVTKYDNFEDAKDDLALEGISLYKIEEEVRLLGAMQRKYQNEMLPEFLQKTENQAIALKWLDETEKKPLGEKTQKALTEK